MHAPFKRVLSQNRTSGSRRPPHINGSNVTCPVAVVEDVKGWLTYRRDARMHQFHAHKMQAVLPALVPSSLSYDIHKSRTHFYISLGEVSAVDIDADFEEAISIGTANKRIIELAQNWCGHLTTEKWGGTGMVEVQTGLPIGMRFFKCPHANAVGAAGMHLQSIALDFYDRNCAGCQKRLPVRLPNLLELVAVRDRAHRVAKEDEIRAAEDASQALKARAARRAEHSKGCDPATAGIFDIIDQLDHDPTQKNRRLLLETVAAAAARFGPGVREALFDLATAGPPRTEAALEVLDTIGAHHGRLCKVALEALARGAGFAVAGEIVAKYLDTTHKELAPNALPPLISLARPARGFGTSGFHGNQEPILAVYRCFPDLTQNAVHTLLRDSSKHVRIAAANSILIVVQIDPNFGLGVVNDLIESLRLPDDIYGFDGSAESWTTRTLARIMLDYPGEVDARIQQVVATSTEDMQSALFDVYEAILRSRNSADDECVEASVKLARELAYRRFVEALA